MIKAVEVINHSGELFRCVLDNPEESGYALTGMEGITPGKGTLNVKEIATLDGGFFLNSRLPSRNIVLNYVFLDTYDNGRYRSIEESRLLFYKYFVVKKYIDVIIETDLHRYKISGYVESNEPEIFSDMEGAQVSIVCPIPYFHLADKTLNENGNIAQAMFNTGLFTFPFSNPFPKKEIIFGDISDRENTVTVYYDGDIDTGVIFHIFVTGNFSTHGAYIDFDYYGNDENNDLVTKLRFNDMRFKQNGGGLQVGDELIISTVVGNKYAVVKRETQTINVLYCLDLIDDWIYLQSGKNVIHVDPIVVIGYPVNLYIEMEYPILIAGV